MLSSIALQSPAPKRSPSNTLLLIALWIAFYASFALFTPALLDDADSVHAEVAREMLLRHDWVTLYANGIRYLEKAPLLYWSMAASFKLFGVSTASARLPLALTVLALVFAAEIFARRAFNSARAGLYAALILLSSFGIFIFTRITIPDAMVCLWLTLALLCFWMTEFWITEQPTQKPAVPSGHSASVLSGRGESPNQRPSIASSSSLRLLCYAFAACCALGVLTKGLIGVVFPVAIVLLYLLLTRGVSCTTARIRQLYPLSSLAVFLALAVPWHVLIALANPAQGHPGGLTFTHGHLTVPLPTDGNVHGWLWFYFVNEQFLRYLNLRVPRDYGTVPLYLFWGLCLVWLMPWSAFIFHALADALPLRSASWRRALGNRTLAARQKTYLLMLLWAAFPMLFFSFSTRQEYYVLPALPALALLIAARLALSEHPAEGPHATQFHQKLRRANLCATAVLLALGAIFAAVATVFLLRTHAPTPSTSLAKLLQQNPTDYALSMGHFLDLDARALDLFRLPLALAAAALFLGPLASFLLRKKNRPHAATLALAAGAFGFLLAAHLGLQTFAPVLSSQQLAADIAPQLAPHPASEPSQPPPLIVIHQEYEFGSTLGFYLRRPSYIQRNGRAVAVNPIHILTDPNYKPAERVPGSPYGRSSNLYYGSFFPDAPAIFETAQSLSAEWRGPRRIFLWQDLANQPSPLPALPGPVYVIGSSGGKEIVSNQPNLP